MYNNKSQKELIEIIKEETIKIIIYTKIYNMGAIYKNIEIEIDNSNNIIIETEIKKDNVIIYIGLYTLMTTNINILIGIIAHEIGHIIYSHNKYINNSAIELQADLYSIKILSIMGYDPLSAIRYIEEYSNNNMRAYSKDYNNYNKNIFNLIQKRINNAYKFISKKY